MTSNTSPSGVDPAVREELARLRDSIDNIDAAVVHMLAERFKCTQQVGHLKAEHQLPPADPAREARQIARLRTLAENAKLDPAFAEKFLNFIIAEVIRHHESIAEDTLNGAEPTTAAAPGSRIFRSSCGDDANVTTGRGQTLPRE